MILLIWSADKFVDGTATTATNLGVSKLVIGLTAVSVGTSAPEILIAISAVLEGKYLLAIGNAIGSNIANIGMVLGCTALLVPLPFAASVLREEMPGLLMGTLLVAVLLFDLHVSVLDGILMLILLSYGLYRLARRIRKDPELRDDIFEEVDEIPKMSMGKSIFWMVAGLVLLLVAAEIVVRMAIRIAVTLEVPEYIIGLTVVAIGTSLPELAATATAAFKNHSEIAIGNVVGSNILNILAVLPVPAILAPGVISVAFYWRDVGMMFVMTTLLALFAYSWRSQKVITRTEGLILLCAYIGYVVLLAVQTV